MDLHRTLAHIHSHDFTKLVPNIFYKDINSGLRLFVDCLGFKLGHSELNSHTPFCVLEKDGLRINLFQDAKYAKEHNPEFRLVTDDIEEVFERIKTNYPEFLHPNLNTVTLRPWGAREFALRDEQVCVIVQKW
jgi:hypothetical protein